MNRVLMLASVASMIDQFNMSNIELLQEMGYAVDVACNFDYGNTCSDERIADLKKRLRERNVNYFQIDFTRNVLNLKQDYVAYKQVKQLLDKNAYTFLHCHSPIGGVVGRVAGHNAGVKVIYTAHGFHFYKGAPLINWMIFYPLEKWMARYTDVLITINEEDYRLAQDKFSPKTLRYLPGVGINTSLYKPSDMDVKCKKHELGIPETAYVMLSVGELNNNKNHSVIIRALKEINDINYHYVICGKGSKKEELQNYAKELGVSKQVHLLGFRTDVAELYAMADVFLFPSKREGLSVALMEAIACGVPAVVSDIRGNRDLVIDGENGYLIDVHDVHGYAHSVVELCKNHLKAQQMSEKGCNRIKQFDITMVTETMREIYQSVTER